MTQTDTDHRLPFGRHQGEPLPAVPSAYLAWLMRTCRLSAGLRQAVADELRRRDLNAPAPDPQPPAAIPACPRCGPDAGRVVRWQEDRTGRRRLRAECGRCRAFLTFPPCRTPFTDEADAAASATPVLDALTALEDVGIELHSDGRAVWVDPASAGCVPPDLAATLRQCSHQLARLMGDNRTR